MDKKEYEELARNVGDLEKSASLKCNTEVQKAQNFYYGYVQGLTDLLKCVRNPD